MSKCEHRFMSVRLTELAELIVAALPGRVSFRSEQEFLELLSLQPVYVEVNRQCRPQS
jgi:hypothetical protein